jgi:tRNA pseudouridine38-40 synthase
MYEHGEKEMKRVKLIVAYDGTNYSGWQVQPNALTVEEVLNETLSDLLGEPITVTGASRTDSGVHSLGNVAVFDTNTRIPAEKISYALNQRLPDDIKIQLSCEVRADFHPRYIESVKTYEYRILRATFPMPTYRRDSYFTYRRLDVGAMKEAAEYFVGTHDFASFCSANAQVKDTVRTILSLDVTEEPVENGVMESDASLIRIRVRGNGFLYNMVRIIAGTLLGVGMGDYRPQDVEQILEARDRTAAGPTAPAHGLTMIGLVYDKSLEKTLDNFNTLE